MSTGISLIVGFGIVLILVCVTMMGFYHFKTCCLFLAAMTILCHLAEDAYEKGFLEYEFIEHIQEIISASQKLGLFKLGTTESIDIIIKMKEN